MTRLDPIFAAPVRPGKGAEAARPRSSSSEFDAFGRMAGADAAVDAHLSGFVRVYAIFSIDPATNELQVRVVDETGRLIRTIPPETVAAMLAAMAAYAGR